MAVERPQVGEGGDEDLFVFTSLFRIALELVVTGTDTIPTSRNSSPCAV